MENRRSPFVVAIAMALAVMAAVFITGLLGWQDANAWTYGLTAAAAFAGGYLGARLRQRT